MLWHRLWSEPCHLQVLINCRVLICSRPFCCNRSGTHAIFGTTTWGAYTNWGDREAIQTPALPVISGYLVTLTSIFLSGFCFSYSAFDLIKCAGTPLRIVALHPFSFLFSLFIIVRWWRPWRNVPGTNISISQHLPSTYRYHNADNCTRG